MIDYEMTQVIDCIDNLEALTEMDAGCIDAIVTDPPYGLAFMGKSWDKTLPDRRTWSELLRVLKPGGHAVIFGAPRLYHRLAVDVEDAGFEVRDCLMWLFGSGFPKSLDVSKAIDKAAGATREVVGTRTLTGNAAQTTKEKGGTYASNTDSRGVPVKEVPITAPATPEARQWEGWGTALKPAYEPILLARKPLDGTVAANVLAHGTGGINVDGCRVGTETITTAHTKYNGKEGWRGNVATGETSEHTGRWPANIILDEEAAAMLDAQTGTLTSGSLMPHHKHKEQVNAYGKSNGASPSRNFGGDSGGASRFFYCAKASKREREAGLQADDGKRANTHPTVKPVALMRWLVRLVTPPGGLVLDPFCGSGSTGVACVYEGVRFLGLELDAGYAEIARQRVAHARCQEGYGR